MGKFFPFNFDQKFGATSTSLKILDRDRSAAIIGGEVASFYFKRENYEKAEIKLLAILEIYENDGWECLAQKIRQDLVELYKRTELFHVSLKMRRGTQETMATG